MKRLIVFGMAILAAAGVQAVQIEKGAYEARAEVIYDLSKSGDPYVAVLAGVGYFVRDNIQVGGYGAFEKKSWSSYWGVTDLFELGVFGEYDFIKYETVMPFLGVSMGLADGDLPEDDTLFMAKATGGLKYFATETMAIALSLNLDMSNKGLFDFRRESNTEGDGDNIGYSVTLGGRSVF